MNREELVYICDGTRYDNVFSIRKTDTNKAKRKGTLCKIYDEYHYKIADRVLEKHIEFEFHKLREYCSDCRLLKFYNVKQSEYYCPQCKE